MVTKAKTERQADIRYRVQLKERPGIVVYLVRSSDDSTDYEVTLVRGKVNNCSCPARKPCYHMEQVQAREWAREAQRRAEYTEAFSIYS